MNPLLSIWLSPRKTFRYLIDHYDAKAVWLLAMLEGIKESMNWAYSCGMGERHGVEFIEVLVLLSGPVIGASNWIAAFLTRWAGQFFKGKGSIEGLFTVLVWINLPSIILVPFWMLLLTVFGANAFTPHLSSVAFQSGDPGLISLSFGWSFLKLVATVWEIIFLVIGMSEVQGFTKWGGFGNAMVGALLTYAIFGLPIYWFFHL